MPQEKIVIVEEKGPGCLGQGIAIAVALFSVFMLLNPSAGIIEFIPDNIPFIGNLDEAALVGILISCLRYLGIDILPFGRKKQIETREVIDVTPKKGPK